MVRIVARRESLGRITLIDRELMGNEAGTLMTVASGEISGGQYFRQKYADIVPHKPALGVSDR